LKVKPVEAQFTKNLYNSCRENTRAYLLTVNGSPVKPEEGCTILADTFGEYSFDIGIADLRHALDAFAHKLGKADAGWDPILATLGNHSFQTSAAYGRDQNAFPGIPACISEANAIW
jgi:hypothetical protein